MANKVFKALSERIWFWIRHRFLVLELRVVEAEVYAIAPLRPRALSVELREIWPAAFSPPRLPLARCPSKNLARDQKKALAPIFSERALLDSLQRWALE
ncbi:MAG: hypothetical protein CL917_04755, partial [Deltaproteobacteria bacterium]|nr:hypothetical protein [Deltaproteobacteria bacterium]